MPKPSPKLLAPSAFRLTALLAACLPAACIDRSNPFDPINHRTPTIEGIRSGYRASLDSLVRDGGDLRDRLKGYRDRYHEDSLAHAAARLANDSARETNRERSAANAAVEAHNLAHPEPDSLRDQAMYRLLVPLPAFGPYDGLVDDRARIQAAASGAAVLMATVNSRNAPLDVYPRSFQDSVLAPLQAVSRGFDALAAALDSANAAVADSNRAIARYNDSRDSANDSVAAFNALVAFLRSTGDNPPIDNPDTLRTTLRDAKPGDTLVLGRGVLEVDLRFASGKADSPIVIRGIPGGRSVLKAIPATTGTVEHVGILQGTTDIRFEDIVFRGGSYSGIKLEAGAERVVFRRCVFDSNGIWGLEAIDSDVSLIDCRIVENRGGGMRYSAAPTSAVSLRMRNVLVARNGGDGLQAVSLQGEIDRSTFADNEGSGIRLSSPDRELTITNSIVALNRGFGIQRQPTHLHQDRFTVKECDIWANAQANFDLREMDSLVVAAIKAKNLEEDPRFTAPQDLDYSLRPDSKLLEYERLPLPIVIGWRRSL